MLFTKGILIASSLAGVGGYLFWKREKQYKTIYNDMSFKTIREYDFSSVLDKDDLPKGKSFIQLNAITQLEDGQLFWSYFDEKDQFLKSRRPFAFSLRNPAGCTIDIVNIANMNKSKQASDVLFFNLKKMSQPLSYEEMNNIHGNVKHSVLQKYMAKNTRFIKKGIEDEGEYSFIGNLKNENGRIIMQPRLVIRGESDRFLLELDKYLIENNRKGKMCFGAMAGFVLLHIAVSKVLFPQYFKKSYRSGPELHSAYGQQAVLNSYREDITSQRIEEGQQQQK